MGCEFCGIVAGEAPADEVYRDEAVVAFLDIHPVVPGHTLVMPTAHREGLPDMVDAEVAAVFRIVRDVAAAQRAALDADGVSVFQSSGAAAGQDVFHVHVHVIPRFEDDHIRFAPSRSTLSDEETADVVAALCGAL
jgi:histidine triad (HIT) family protein